MAEMKWRREGGGGEEWGESGVERNLAAIPSLLRAGVQEWPPARARALLRARARDAGKCTGH